MEYKQTNPFHVISTFFFPIKTCMLQHHGTTKKLNENMHVRYFSLVMHDMGTNAMAKRLFVKEMLGKGITEE